jgi:hypothetical protein
MKPVIILLFLSLSSCTVQEASVFGYERGVGARCVSRPLFDSATGTRGYQISMVLYQPRPARFEQPLWLENDEIAIDDHQWCVLEADLQALPEDVDKMCQTLR